MKRKKGSDKDDTVVNKHIIIGIILSIFIVGVMFLFRPLNVQQFSDAVVEYSTPEGATLNEGMRLAYESALAGEGISIRWIRDAASYVRSTAEDAAGEVAGAVRFRKTNIQRATRGKVFKILIIGNNVNHNTLVNWCRGIKTKFNSLPPYSDISNQFTIDCGTLPFTVKGVNSNPAAQAWMLTLAKFKKQELGYDYVFVLQNGDGRSFALPTFASLVYYEKDKTTKIFMHELSHMFAGLADEYSHSQDINQINSILSKLQVGTRINNQLDLFSAFGLIDPPNCINKPRAGCGSWYEGCALVRTGVCRPTENSMMRDYLFQEFNQESKDRILEVARGKNIVTGSGILR